MSLAPGTPADMPINSPAPLAVHRDPPPDATHDVMPDFPPPQFVKPARLASLDVFRGLTIAFMVLVNNAGGPAYEQLEHATWHGWTATDLVFPFFLFIVGVAIPFSLSKRGEVATRRELLGRIWIRALSLFMLGQLLAAINLPLPWVNVPTQGFVFTKIMRTLGFFGCYAGLFALLIPWRSKRVALWLPLAITVVFYAFAIAMHFVRSKAVENGWPPDTFGAGVFNPDRLRIPGVLQRIGICYGVAATIAVYASWRFVFLSMLALCTFYTVLMFKVPVKGHVLGSLDVYDNFARTIDVKVLERWAVDAQGAPYMITQKHTYVEYPDNEGIVSTLPAIATALCGVLVGLWLITPRTAVERCAGLLAFSGPVILLGIVLDHALMPINKNLWTPSFTVFTAGMAMLVLGTVFWLCDVLGRRRWAWPFTVMGMNAIAAFVASSLVLRVARFFPNFELSNGKKDAFFYSYVNDRLKIALGDASTWLHTHAPQLPMIDTPQNASLLYAVAFVVVIFLLMWVLYVCRIFVKV